MLWSAPALGLLLLLASCGVSRDAPSDAALPAGGEFEPSDGDHEGDDHEGDEDHGDDAEGDASAETTVPTTPPVEPTPPPSTAPAAEIAVSADLGAGLWELTHGELNDVVIPTWENQEFLGLAFGGAVPNGFYPGVTYEHVVREAMNQELADLGAEVSEADTSAARADLATFMQGWFADQADPVAEADRLYNEVPYLSFVVGQQATQAALATALEESGALIGEVPCVRHILLDDEAAAQEVLDLLNDGGDFAELAAERSTGPTGPNGGDLGCAPSGNYVPEFAAAVDGATLGEYVGPLETQFGWHVLVVDRFEETELNPSDVIGQRIQDRLRAATVEVDDRLGTWDPEALTILPAASQ